MTYHARHTEEDQETLEGSEDTLKTLLDQAELAEEEGHHLAAEILRSAFEAREGRWAGDSRGVLGDLGLNG